MATLEQIAQLRAWINEPIDAAPWTDAYLSGRIDGASSLESLSATIWREKAGGYAELVDVQEGSSRRALGDLYDQALKMAAHFDNQTGGGAGAVRPARTRQIERP